MSFGQYTDLLFCIFKVLCFVRLLRLLKLLCRLRLRYVLLFNVRIVLSLKMRYSFRANKMEVSIAKLGGFFQKKTMYLKTNSMNLKF